jgi:putative spermidine/putrescine transport system ATP-binding protein
MMVENSELLSAESHRAVVGENRLAGKVPKLRVTGLTKRYGTSVSLAGADIDMADGEFLTLLGPSGSGKTTLLSLIAGLTAPDEGEIWIEGRNATHLPSKKRDLGLVFQHYALFPHLSIFDNIAFPLRMRRRPEQEVRKAVENVLDVVRLSDLRERFPSELSGGQQQRVALARCFVYQPSIILMDEPLGALDKRLRDHMQVEIIRLSREFGASVIYVTHDQEEALVMSDRICLINEGRIEQIGTPHELYFCPATLFAASFIGESNLFDVEVASTGDAHLANGTPVRGRKTGPLPAGRAKLVVRPESIRVLGTHDTADNRINARVERVLLTGAMTRIHARLPDGTPVVAALPSELRGLPVSPGQEIALGFASAAAMLLGASQNGRIGGQPT